MDAGPALSLRGQLDWRPPSGSVGAGVADPGEITAHSPNFEWWRVRLYLKEELGEVALDSYLLSTSGRVAIFSLNGAIPSCGCEILVTLGC